MVRFEQMATPSHWESVLEEIDVVVNCVGILRERGAETYDRVHHFAPAILAEACTRRGVKRLIHVSALGLHEDARSGFITSKLQGEREIQASTLDWTIVRPSLLDGEGGFGALWMRRVARWPVHFVPVDAQGRLAALDVGDLGDAIAVLCEITERSDLREVELGGSELRTMREHLAALRRAAGYSPAVCVSVPAWLARIGSHICDLLHFSPFSYGHLELLRRNNVPRLNLLSQLLKRAPRLVGMSERTVGKPVASGSFVA
jgi:NADH dehydrogenase